ncbi:MAG: inositol monophosphatase [Planctomycetota bacterium]
MTRTELAAARRTAARLRSPTRTAVAEVAQRIARAQHRLKPGDVRRKGKGDFVTRIDVRSERELQRALFTIMPDAGFLGEESEHAVLDREWIWVVDPIDGTSNFARGLPHFAVSVALLWRGHPLLACIHCAPEQASYTAVSGAGAHRNGRPVRLPPGRLDDGAMLGCQWHRGQQQLDFLARLQSRGSRIRTLGSTVTQLADLVMGRLDANIQEQGRVWDIAAAGLVILEAGGKFTDWVGKPLFPFVDLTIGHSPSIAASPRVHRALLELLA